MEKAETKVEGVAGGTKPRPEAPVLSVRGRDQRIGDPFFVNSKFKPFRKGFTPMR